MRHSRGLVRIAAAEAEVLFHRVARQRLDAGRTGVVAERTDLLGVKAFGDG